MKSKGFAWIFLITSVAMLALICVLVYEMGMEGGTSAIIGTAVAALEGAVFMWVASNAYDAFEDSECEDSENNE